MHKEDVLRRIADAGVIPVIRVASADDAVALVGAIASAGLAVAEITMTVPDAPGVIDRLVREYGDDVLVGAGTVLDADAARSCIASGAQFVVSPSIELDVIEVCRGRGVAVLPGALTPSEIRAARRAGADVVKVFPCDAMGGPSYIRSLRAPMPDIPLVPTGGVSLDSIGDYLRAGVLAVGVGGELVSAKAVRAGDFDSIARSARAYVAAVREARG